MRRRSGDGGSSRFTKRLAQLGPTVCTCAVVRCGGGSEMTGLALDSKVRARNHLNERLTDTPDSVRYRKERRVQRESDSIQIAEGRRNDRYQ